MRVNSERGAMIIMVAICLLGITLLSAFVLDQGVMYTAKRQAQNAADAGALSAAWWLMDRPTDTAGAQIAARKMANANPVWGQNPLTPDILVQTGVTCPPVTGGGTDCVRVDVMRGATDRFGGTHSNTLPVMFASLMGINSQQIQATATAQMAAANEADCLRPWFVLDKAGGGYTTADIGTQFVLDSEVTPSGYGKIDVGSGEDAIRDAVHECADGDSFHIGQTVGTQTGGAGHPTVDAVNDVIQWDLGAHYDSVTKSIQGSCAPHCNCSPFICPNVGKGMSPRVFIAPICSPTGDPGCVSGGNGQTHEITITNFLTYFIESATSHGNDIRIVATLMSGAGDIDPEGGTSPAPFLHVVRLVR